MTPVSPQKKGELPAGLKLRNVYKGIEFTAEVLEGGKVRFEGTTYKSLNRATIAAIQSTGSPGKTESAWRWWNFIRPETGEEKSLLTLRK